MMDARDSDKAKTVDLLGGLEGKEPLNSQQPSLKRELDSIDDFEHLEHDISPLKEVAKVSSGHDHTTREFLEKINKGVADSAENVASKLADDASNFDPLRKDGLFDKTASAVAMDSNLLELANTFPDRKEADAKLDKFLSEISSISPGPTEKQLKENIKEKIEDVKSASQNFMDMERGPVFHHDPSPVISSTHDIIERFTDSEPEDDFKPSKEDLSKIKDNDNVKTDMFKDFDDFELPKASAPILEPQKVQEVKINDSVKVPEIPAPKQPPLEPIVKEVPVKIPEPIKSEPVVRPAKEPVKIETSKPVSEPASKKDLDVKKKPEIPIKIESKPKTQAEAMFCKMGLGKSISLFIKLFFFD